MKKFWDTLAVGWLWGLAMGILGWGIWGLVRASIFFYVSFGWHGLVGFLGFIAAIVFTIWAAVRAENR